MPRCTKNELIVKPTRLQGYQDNEEVFYCEATREIFRDYEEFFKRIMLVNSTIWACEATGRENLTYAEALKSEKKAIEKGKGLREVLKAPTLILTKLAQQSSHYELGKLLYQFFKEQYLIGEKVALVECSQRHTYEIIDMIKPKDANDRHTINSSETSSLSITQQHCNHQTKYKLKKIDDNKKNTNSTEKINTIMVTIDQMKRLQSDYSFDRLNCFLKENTQLIDGLICPKENIYKKYVTDHNLTFQKLFACEMPQWKAKMKKSEKKEKLDNREKVKKGISNKNANEKDNTNNLNENNNKKKKSSISLEKEIKNKDKKQQTLSQYLVKSNGETTDNTENINNLMIEMERKRKEREAQQLEIERKKADMNMKAEQEVLRVLTKCDDLERDDQKPLPQFKPIRTIVPNKYFGDLLMIQEFLHSYSPILSVRDIFPNNITFHNMCRALTKREVAGPLSDLLQVLLSTIFNLQIEEDEESTIEYRNSVVTTNATEYHITINRATKTHHFINKHYSHKIYELPVDSLTLSEILRLHLLSSGAATTEKCTKWRFMYRNGYSNTEDPGLLLRIKQPHILRALKLYSVYQLPIDDIVKIIKCLIDQILTYQTTITLLEEREDNLSQLKHTIRNLYIAENKRILLSTNKKKNLTNEYNLKMNDVSDPDEKKKILNELDTKIARIVAEDEKEKKEYEYQLLEARSQIFDHIINLGMDRCYRQYFILESICGLFIEHPENTFDDKCLENPPQNCMELSNLPHVKNKLKSFFIQRLKEMEKENNSLKKSNTNNEISSSSSTTTTVSGGSNKENSKINGLLKKNVISTLMNGSTSSPTVPTPSSQLTLVAESGDNTDDVKTIEYGPQPYNPSQYELYMCTGDPQNCIVHNLKDGNRRQWSYIHTQEDLDALIDALNPYGKRESALREQLITYKSLISKHITNCPINDLSIDEKNSKNKFLNQIKSEKKYLNANLGYHIDYNNIDDILYGALLDKILQFEVDISKGHLGKLKVKDIEKWRNDLLNSKYDPQCRNLIYGIKNDTIATETESVIDFEDPGDGLGNTTEIISEDSGNSDNDDDLLPLHDSPETRKLVQNLASALLQIEQGIEQKFLKEPFGIKNELKDKEANETRLALGRVRLKNWESSLMKSTNYSQIFLHLNIIWDAVKWTRSSNQARCIKCRKKSLPDQMLLCDECNAGMHMFCMEPKLTSIPEGNWYCKKCIQKLGLETNVEQNITKKRKKVFKMDDDESSTEEENVNNNEETEEDENNSTADSDEKIPPMRKSKRLSDNRSKKNKTTVVFEDDENEEIETEEETYSRIIVNGKGKTSVNNVSSEDDEEDSSKRTCKECDFNDADIICNTCNSWYHFECTDLRRVPRGIWECNQCKTKIKTNGKNLKRKFEENSLSESEESNELHVKRSKQQSQRQQQQQQKPHIIETRNLRKRNNNDENKRTNGMNSRRSRHIADNSLPLNSVILYDLLDAIMKHEDAWPFLRPVIPSQVPDYHLVIKKPMDFGQIKSNLNMGKYHKNQEVMNDIELVFKNCDLYNTDGNDVYRAGKSLELFVCKKCKELKLSFRPSDMISNIK